MFELENFVGKYRYFIRVISGCDSPLIALNGKIARQGKTKSFHVYMQMYIYITFLMTMFLSYGNPSTDLHCK